MLRLSHCVVDLDRRRVCRPDPVPLTCREAELLRYLAARAGRPVSRDELLREVFGYSERVVSRAVDSVVRRLRAKIEADPDNPVHLLTEFGVGYRLSLDAAPEAPRPVALARPLLALSGGEVDLAAGSIRRPEGAIPLVGNELTLLRELVRSAGEVIAARDLERRVWGASLGGSNRLRSLIWRLRAKIERHPDAPAHLFALRGHGYRFVLPDAASRSVRATVLAATIPPDRTGERTEALWRAAAEVAERCGGQPTNRAAGQICLVFADPAGARRAVDPLRRAVAGVRLALATGEVRPVQSPGASAPEYVGAPLADALERCRDPSAEPWLPDLAPERVAAA